MTNFEYYKDEIQKMIDADKIIAVRDGKVVACAAIRCNDCKFKSTNDSLSSCTSRMLLWLYEEHKETSTLTAREWHMLKAIEKGYLAKDKQGYLKVYSSIPHRMPHFWAAKSNAKVLNLTELDVFNFIKWEDEPYSIEEMLTWEHEEEYENI